MYACNVRKCYLLLIVKCIEKFKVLLKYSYWNYKFSAHCDTLT